jgi:pimeloyl-ACP methyl ester carboxylesterase
VNPLVLVPGGPGLPHDYLETLEAVVESDRRIISFDPIGTGQSSKSLPSLGGPAAVGSFVTQQLDAVVRFLELKEHHVWAHGRRKGDDWGWQRDPC